MEKDKEVKKEDTTKKTENKEKEVKKKTTPKKKPKKIKPYIHIDTFLQTAKHLYGLNNIQAQGFKSRMNGRHYQKDEQVFVKELKGYLNIK